MSSIKHQRVFGFGLKSWLWVRLPKAKIFIFDQALKTPKEKSGQSINIVCKLEALHKVIHYTQYENYRPLSTERF